MGESEDFIKLGMVCSGEWVKGTSLWLSSSPVIGRPTPARRPLAFTPVRAETGVHLGFTYHSPSCGLADVTGDQSSRQFGPMLPLVFIKFHLISCPPAFSPPCVFLLLFLFFLLFFFFCIFFYLYFCLFYISIFYFSIFSVFLFSIFSCSSFLFFLFVFFFIHPSL